MLLICGSPSPSSCNANAALFSEDSRGFFPLFRLAAPQIFPSLLPPARIHTPSMSLKKVVDLYKRNLLLSPTSTEDFFGDLLPTAGALSAGTRPPSGREVGTSFRLFLPSTKNPTFLPLLGVLCRRTRFFSFAPVSREEVRVPFFPDRPLIFFANSFSGR